MRAAELDGILQQVRQRRREDRTIAVKGQPFLDGSDDHLEIDGRRLDRDGLARLRYEVGLRDAFAALRDSRGQT